MAPYMQTVYDKVSVLPTPTGKDLFQLNEAIFNIDRDDDPSTELATKLFTWIQKVHRGFLAGKIGHDDENYLNDYLGLLGTMQNQAFFSVKQVQRLQGFMKESLVHDSPEVVAKDAKSSTQQRKIVPPLDNGEIKKLVDAVKIIQSFATPDAVEAAPKKAAAASSVPQDGPEAKKKSRSSRGGRGKKETTDEAKVDAPEASAEQTVSAEKKGRKRGGAGRGGKKEASADAPAPEAKDKAEAGEKTDKSRGRRKRGGKGKEKGKEGSAGD